MDGFRYSKSQASTGTDWNLLPKPRARAMPTTVDTQLALPNYAANSDSALEGTQLSMPPSPTAEPDGSPRDDSPPSPDGWSKRQLSCPPKSTDSEFLDFTQGSDDAPAKEQESEKVPARDGRSSPEPNCSICLEKVVNRSFTNGCLHTFCFSCLVQWSKIKAECPLCKQAFKSIIHNVQENNKYDEYHVVTPLPAPDRNEFSEFRDFITALEVSLPSFREPGRYGQPFRYSTTLTSDRQRIVYSSSSPWVIPTATSAVPDRWRRYGFTVRHSRRTNFRKNVYTRDLWAIPPMDVTGRYRECTPEFFRLNPALVHRLAPWLNRELNALVNNSLTSVILDMILNAVTRHEITSPEFHRLVLPHLNDRTNHFIHEFFSFARSPFDMIGYDQALTYGPNPNRAAMHVVVSDDSSSDSDVLILSPNVAGPSGVNTQSAANRTAPVADADDSDDCQVVQYVKPRHERTPEIIDLLSEDEGTVVNSDIVEAVPVVTDDSVSTQSVVESGGSEYLPNKKDKGKSKKRPREASTKPIKKRPCCHLTGLGDSDSTLSLPDTTALESFVLGKKTKSKKSSKEGDNKKVTSKSSRHSADTKTSVTKKDKSRKRKPTFLLSDSESSDDDLKVLAKRMLSTSTDRHKSRKIIYSSDEAGPSSSYRNHLRSGNRPLASYYQPDSSSSTNSRAEMVSLGNDHISPITSYHQMFSAASDDASANTYLPFPMHEQSGPGFYTDSGNSFYGFSSQPDHRTSSPLPFVSCEPILPRSCLPTASTSSANTNQVSEPRPTHSSPLSQHDHSPIHISPQSFFSNFVDVYDTNLPSTSGMNQGQSIIKSKHKPISPPDNSDRKRCRKKSKSEHNCKKNHSSRHSSSPESTSVQSWVIKPGHDEQEQPSLPDTSVHSSPMTDASEGRPRLKSIIISRQNPNSFSHSASSSSYSSRHSRRKYKHRRLPEPNASSSGTDEW